MPPNPRPLILRLLLGHQGQGDGTLGVRELLAACALFGVPANSVRVALARAVAAGLLTLPRRGCYALGPQARAVADEVARWRGQAAQLVDWQGDWMAVHDGASGRSDRAALRARERAFGLLGLAEFERGLHLRPANLAGGVAALRQRLQALLPAGAEAGTVFRLGELSPADRQRACGLWDGLALDARYRDGTALLSAWLDGAAQRPLAEAARQAFELGNAAIRQLVFDPLLPAPLVDAGARERFAATVARFDAAGQALWRRFLEAERGRPASAAAAAAAPDFPLETTA